MTDYVIEWLRTEKIPVTRENYIDVAYLGDPPKPWTAADEAELPDELQDWSNFKVSGRDLELIG